MTFHTLRPVGEPITCTRSADDPADLFGSLSATFYQSGTAALAAAIAAAIKRSGNPDAEVILPAYSCPSLVSAVLFNRARPVLVDLAENSFTLDIESLKAVLSKNTVAVISVDLFGLPSITTKLRQLMAEHDITLIHDCAQATFCDHRACAISKEIVILSFGRGKPASILAGGAVVHAAKQKLQLPETPRLALQGLSGRFKVWLKYRLYNLIIKPRVYWITEYLPLKIGNTEYSALEEIAAAPATELSYLKTNIHRASSQQQPHRIGYEKLFKPLTKLGWVDLCKNHDPQGSHQLLRYAVLAPSKLIRDKVLQHTDAAGLGMTHLYGQILPNIEAMPNIFSPLPAYPNAESFAGRLITMPLHTHTHANSLRAIAAILKSHD